MLLIQIHVQAVQLAISWIKFPSTLFIWKIWIGWPRPDVVTIFTSLMVIPSQVCCCFDRNVQWVGSRIKIHSTHGMPQVKIKKGPHAGNIISFLSHPLFLFHCKIWWSGMDDISHVLLGTDQWLSHSMRPHCSSKRVQGWWNVDHHEWVSISS